MHRLAAAITVVGALLGAACGTGSVPTSTATPSTRTPASIVERRPFPVEVFEETFEDEGRDRTLPVRVHRPRGAGPFPMVVLSHGLSAAARFLDPLAEPLAEAGYVVVAPTFPKTSGAGGAQLLDVTNQPADVSFVIDEVLAASSVAGSQFAGLIDEDEIAAAGHSLGAITSLMAGYHSCCLDDRLDAVVSLAGAAILAPSGAWFADDDAPPLLMVHGDRDLLVLYALGQSAFEQAPPPKYFATLIAASHSPPYVGEQPYFDVVVDSMVAFFDSYLVDDDAALDRLREVGEVDDVAELEAVG
ncbi:MAG: hypothetical protein HYU28_08040 [Actinobacteria bacterium]|nr:hypothetical protein [Actinomycetota bacterium]